MVTRQINYFIQRKYKIVVSILVISISSIWAISSAFSKTESKPTFQSSILEIEFPEKSDKKVMQTGACGILQ